MICWKSVQQKNQIESVQSTLNYIIPGGEKPVTQSNLPGEVRVTSNTGNYQAHSVTIRNGRLDERILPGQRRFPLGAA